MIARIETLKNLSGLSTRAFAIKCGLNQPTLDRMLKGINALNLNCVTAILKSFPDVSAEWLLRGTGPIFLSDSTQSNEKAYSLIDTITTLQDVINSKDASIKALMEENRQLKAKMK